MNSSVTEEGVIPGVIHHDHQCYLCRVIYTCCRAGCMRYECEERQICDNCAHIWLKDMKFMYEMLSGRLGIPHTLHYCQECKKAYDKRIKYIKKVALDGE